MKVWTLKELLGELETDEATVSRTSGEFQDYLTGYIFHANIMFAEIIKRLPQSREDADEDKYKKAIKIFEKIIKKLDYS